MFIAISLSGWLVGLLAGWVVGWLTRWLPCPCWESCVRYTYLSAAYHVEMIDAPVGVADSARRQTKAMMFVTQSPWKSVLTPRLFPTGGPVALSSVGTKQPFRWRPRYYSACLGRPIELGAQTPRNLPARQHLPPLVAFRLGPTQTIDVVQAQTERTVIYVHIIVYVCT